MLGKIGAGLGFLSPPNSAELWGYYFSSVGYTADGLEVIDASKNPLGNAKIVSRYMAKGDGSSAYIAMPNLPALSFNSYEVEFVVGSKTTGNYEPIDGLFGYSAFVSLDYANSRVVVISFTGGYKSTSILWNAVPVEGDKIKVTFNNGTVRLFINDTEQADSPKTHPTVTFDLGSSPLHRLLWNDDGYADVTISDYKLTLNGTSVS